MKLEMAKSIRDGKTEILNGTLHLKEVQEHGWKTTCCDLQRDRASDS